MVVGIVIALVVLLVFSAYFSATETAFTSFNAVRMKVLAEKKKSAKLVLKLADNYNRVLSTLLIGNNIVNIAAASLATLVFTGWFGQDLGTTLSTVVMTVLVLIFGEISPKSVAKEFPEKFAMISAYPLWFFTVIFTPLNLIFDLWKKLLNKIFRVDKKQPSLTEEEFQVMVGEITDEGVLNETEHDIIINTIKYDDMTVENVMRFAEDATEARIGDDFGLIKSIFVKTNYSRLPVLDAAGEKAEGILYRADFYEMLLDGRSDFAALLKKPMFTTRTEKISHLFKAMQTARIHMAIVLDDGKYTGLVTMEDILEELMGEIEDRYDPIPEDDEDDNTAGAETQPASADGAAQSETQPPSESGATDSETEKASESDASGKPTTEG